MIGRSRCPCLTCPRTQYFFVACRQIWNVEPMQIEPWPSLETQGHKPLATPLHPTRPLKVAIFPFQPKKAHFPL